MESDDEESSRNLLQLQPEDASTVKQHDDAPKIYGARNFFIAPLIPALVMIGIILAALVIVDLVNSNPEFTTSAVSITTNGPDVAIKINANMRTHQYLSEIFVSCF